MRVRMLTYGPSASARSLSQALGIPRIRSEGSRFVPRDHDLIVNWGNAALNGLPGRYWMGTVRWLNYPRSVAWARNKLDTFNFMLGANVTTVDWTTDKSVAIGWANDDKGVFVRTSVTGQGGSGIIYVPPGSPDPHVLPDAPLYTKAWPAMHEYRVHQFGARYHVAKKRRRNGVEPSPIRNHDNGYVYCTDNVVAPDSVLAAARAAITALGLDFGAVDILCSSDGQTAKVLEVNTAPGLEGRTLDFYRECIAERMVR